MFIKKISVSSATNLVGILVRCLLGGLGDSDRSCIDTCPNFFVGTRSCHRCFYDLLSEPRCIIEILSQKPKKRKKGKYLATWWWSPPDSYIHCHHHHFSSSIYLVSSGGINRIFLLKVPQLFMHYLYILRFTDYGLRFI